jgi:putative transposase
MQYTLTRSHVHKLASELLIEYLKLRDYKRSGPGRTLLAIIFAACARLVSISAAAADLLRGPSPETVRKALRANTPTLEILEPRLNRALRATRPTTRFRRAHVSVDLTLIPYHGQPQTHDNELYRSQAKSGTTHFHAYATAYLIRHGQRQTLALISVKKGTDLAVVLKRLMALVRKADVHPSLVLLDRGFYCVSAIRYFQAARIPFLMPVPLRGRKKEHPKGPGGTRVFGYWSKGGRGQHTLTNTDQRTATVGIVVHCRNRAGRRGKHGREHLVYAYWGWDPPSAAPVSQLYRRRFGIETSYRQMNQGRARTCTKSPAVRLLLVGVALILRNVWAWLHWSVLSAPQRGRRILCLERLPLKTLLLMLLAVAIELFGINDAIIAQQAIPDQIGT